MKRRAIFFITVAMLGLISKAMATTFSFEPAADARVIDIQGFQNLNFASDILSCYTEISGNNTQRTMIYFDLSSISLAPTQIVQSATLTLIAQFSFGNNSSNLPMQIYRLTSPWSEASMTWSNRDTTHTWTTAGGDFVGLNGKPYAISTSSPTNGGSVTWDVTALVQEWVNHTSTNYGLMLKSESGNHLVFDQREVATVALRPNLTVVVGPGLPVFHGYSSGGQMVLWWTSTNSVLQERTNLSPTAAWSDSVRPVTQSNGSNSVTISSPKGNNFFRLRNGP